MRLVATLATESPVATVIRCETTTIKSVPARLMAVRRYSGTWSEERYRTNEQQLIAAVQAAGLKTLGPPIFARYNAPFSLWFLRRNEVLIEVAAP